MSDDSMRYWAALNRLRASSASLYGAYLAFERLNTAMSSKRSPPLIFGGVGLLVLVLTGVFVIPYAPENIGPASISVIGIGLGGFFVYFGITSWRWARTRMQALAAYQAGEAQRASCRDVLASLAERWDGKLESAAIEPAIRFLTEHWPDRGPIGTVLPFRCADENRLTVTGTVLGYPTLC